MCIFLYSFCFSINYKCNYGEFIALIGNTEELGNWDTSKALELQWTEGDNWRKYCSFKQKNDAIFQYKYLVCRRNGSKIEVVRWEEGPNRYLNLKQLTKLFISVEDVWEKRKISFFLKDNKNSFPSIHIIGKHELLGNMHKAQEMKKVIYACPIEKILHTFWYKQIIVPAQNAIYNIVYNYISFNSELKSWEVIGNETNAKLDYASSEDSIERFKNYEIQNSAKKEQNSKIKKHKSGYLGTSFDSPYFTRLEKSDLQIFQDVELFEEKGQIFKINEFLQTGPLNNEIITLAKSRNIKKVLVFTNLKNVSFGTQDFDCLNSKSLFSNDILVDIIDLNCSKHIKIKECAYYMENALKKSENTLICWGNSKRETFKTLIDYFCLYKKFSIEAAKKFLKMSNSRETLKRRSSKHMMSR